MTEGPRTFLRRLFDDAVASALPDRCVPLALPPLPLGRTVVVGAGKAAAAMARAVEDHWRGEISGLVVTRYGHRRPTRRIEVAEAGHPVPDASGARAAARILALVRGLTPDDLVLCLISGGGSALLTLPAPGLTLEDKQAVTTALLRCGATIGEINCVRKHLSAIKGGRLARAAAPAPLRALLISDVPGDDPAVIASGPTVADPTTLADARAVLTKYAIAPPAAVRRALDDPANESPKPGDACFAASHAHLIARPREALAAAASRARASDVEAVIIGDAVEGEARVVAREHAALARAGTSRPRVILSGGELTVTVRGGGRGGPNTEYLLSLAIALDGARGIHALACDSDGIDGSEDNAGAVIGPETLARARALGIDARDHLERNDAYGFFAALGDLVITGPTHTNVNDFRAILTGAD